VSSTLGWAAFGIAQDTYLFTSMEEVTIQLAGLLYCTNASPRYIFAAERRLDRRWGFLETWDWECWFCMWMIQEKSGGTHHTAYQCSDKRSCLNTSYANLLSEFGIRAGGDVCLNMYFELGFSSRPVGWVHKQNNKHSSVCLQLHLHLFCQAACICCRCLGHEHRSGEPVTGAHQPAYCRIKEKKKKKRNSMCSSYVGYGRAIHLKGWGSRLIEVRAIVADEKSCRVAHVVWLEGLLFCPDVPPPRTL
jgi:hypothetical protein